jgi:nucleotide-binding universal stress UspA family protein
VQTFSTVLAVTDFSDLSNRAIPFAYAIVRDGGTVHLLHLLEKSPTPSPLYAHYTEQSLNLPEERRRIQETMEAALRKLIPSEAAARKIATITAAPLHEEIAPGILAEARARKVEAIVMGTHGRTGLSRLVLGSVAQDVLCASHIPVLMVPPASLR